MAADKARNLVVLQRKIFITMPPHVVLDSMTVRPGSLVLYKLRPGCPQVDKRRFETEDLDVRGDCSDGVRRTLTSSVIGTTYESSNEKIATVSKEGRVTAQGTGTTVITVRNGTQRGEVKVTVRPCSQF